MLIVNNNQLSAMVSVAYVKSVYMTNVRNTTTALNSYVRP